MEELFVRGAEWFSQISWVSQSHFLNGSVCLQSQFFHKAVLESQSPSCNLKIRKVSDSQRKNLVLPSRKVSNLPFATPIVFENLCHGTLASHPSLDKSCFNE